MVAAILEESEMGVIECETAEQALSVLEKLGASLSLVFTDIRLAGQIDGIALAHFARQQYPNLHVIVTSGFELTERLPAGVKFMSKPWIALDLLRAAEGCKLSSGWTSASD